MIREKEVLDGDGLLLLRQGPLANSQGKEEERSGELAGSLGCSFEGCKFVHSLSWYARCQTGQTEFRLLSNGRERKKLGKIVG